MDRSGVLLEPVLVDVGTDRGRALGSAVGPHVAIVEAHHVKRLARQARFVIRELLGIAKAAVQTHDGAALATQVCGRAAMALGLRRAYPHARTGFESFIHGWLDCAR